MCMCVYAPHGHGLSNIYTYITAHKSSSLKHLYTYIHTCMNAHGLLEPHTYIYTHVHECRQNLQLETHTYCDLQNNWKISSVFNGFRYQFTTEPRRSVFQWYSKSQYIYTHAHECQQPAWKTYIHMYTRTWMHTELPSCAYTYIYTHVHECM